MFCYLILKYEAMSKIQEVIKKKERNFFPFQPSRSFYEKININQKRWGMLTRGVASPTIDELKSIATFFEVEVTEFF